MSSQNYDAKYSNYFLPNCFVFFFFRCELPFFLGGVLEQVSLSEEELHRFQQSLDAAELNSDGGKLW